MLAELPSEKEHVELPDETKIFYCSRTHSQLSQFVNEIRKIKLRPGIWEEATTKPSMNGAIEPSTVKHLPLGSRKNLCINDKVSKLGSAVAINERCLELQRQATTKENRCCFLPTKENQTLVSDFRDHTLAKIQDIEDLGTIGKEIGICPYYATRQTIKPSEASKILRLHHSR